MGTQGKFSFYVKDSSLESSMHQGGWKRHASQTARSWGAVYCGNTTGVENVGPAYPAQAAHVLTTPFHWLGTLLRCDNTYKVQVSTEPTKLTKDLESSWGNTAYTPLIAARRWRADTQSTKVHRRNIPVSLDLRCRPMQDPAHELEISCTDSCNECMHTRRLRQCSNDVMQKGVYIIVSHTRYDPRGGTTCTLPGF